MLFSPPNEYDRNYVYLLVGITCSIHVALLTMLFIVEGYFSREKPLIFDLKNMGSRVSMLSQPRKRTQVKKQSVRKKRPVKKVQPKKKAVVKKKAVPKKAVTKKTIPIKKKVVKKPVKKAPVKKAVKASPAKAASIKPVAKEFNVGDAAMSSDKVIREIYRHLTIPPGIEDVAVFTMVFDINDKGKVVNLKPRGSEPLVIYTAFKDALLRCTMPIKNRKNIPLVIK